MVIERNERDELARDEQATDEMDARQHIVKDAREPDHCRISSINHNIRLHRGLILKELIDEFKRIDPLQDNIIMQLFTPNGMEEAAEDNGCVT